MGGPLSIRIKRGRVYLIHVLCLNIWIQTIGDREKKKPGSK
jgi:hypothetical protein